MKRKFVGGMFALCLALSMASCGKGSEEQQAANYYQKEPGLDKKTTEESAHELYEEGEEEPGVTEKAPEKTGVEPLPELVNSEWYDQKVQIYDMVFTNDWHMTEEDIRKIVEGSAYDVELTERLYNEDVYLDLKVNGIYSACFKIVNWSDDLIEYGLVDDGDYYSIDYGDYSELHELPYRVWYDKAHIEFESLKTRDDVLAYLAENGFVEVETSQTPYYNAGFSTRVYPDKSPVEFADIPHYWSVSEEYITFYRIHKLSETDQEVERRDTFPWVLYSGAHLNLVNVVNFSFDMNGNIMNRPYKLELGHYTIMGELTGEKWDIYNDVPQ